METMAKLQGSEVSLRWLTGTLAERRQAVDAKARSVRLSGCSSGCTQAYSFIQDRGICNTTETEIQPNEQPRVK